MLFAVGESALGAGRVTRTTSSPNMRRDRLRRVAFQLRHAEVGEDVHVVRHIGEDLRVEIADLRMTFEAREFEAGQVQHRVRREVGHHEVKIVEFVDRDAVLDDGLFQRVLLDQVCDAISHVVSPFAAAQSAVRVQVWCQPRAAGACRVR